MTSRSRTIEVFGDIEGNLEIIERIIKDFDVNSKKIFLGDIVNIDKLEFSITFLTLVLSMSEIPIIHRDISNLEYFNIWNNKGLNMKFENDNQKEKIINEINQRRLDDVNFIIGNKEIKLYRTFFNKSTRDESLLKQLTENDRKVLETYLSLCVPYVIFDNILFCHSYYLYDNLSEIFPIKKHFNENFSKDSEISMDLMSEKFQSNMKNELNVFKNVNIVRVLIKTLEDAQYSQTHPNINGKIPIKRIICGHSKSYGNYFFKDIPVTVIDLTEYYSPTKERLIYKRFGIPRVKLLSINDYDIGPFEFYTEEFKIKPIINISRIYDPDNDQNLF